MLHVEDYRNIYQWATTRGRYVTGNEAFTALEDGYYLLNIKHKHSVYQLLGKQIKSNKKRNRDYMFDNEQTWVIGKRIPLWMRIMNKIWGYFR